MREFVEQHGDELHVVPAQHRAHHGVPELAERRIGRDTGHGHVVSPGREPPGLAVGIPFVKIAAVAYAPGHRETRVPRLEGKLGGREHVPDDKVPLDIGVRAVRVIVGQTELVDGKLAGLPDQLQASSKRRRRVRPLDNLGDRLTFARQFQLSFRRLYVIASGQRHDDHDWKDETAHSGTMTRCRSIS